jgi:DNA replication protein DnaC
MIGPELDAALKRLEKLPQLPPDNTVHAKDAARLFGAACVPNRHSIKTATQHPQWAEKLATAQTLVASGATIALVGTRGSGKTQMAVECIREATSGLKSALFTTAMAFFMDVKATFKRDAANDERKVVAGYAMPHLLVVDEIGKRGESEWENNLLFELLNRRYNAIKPTILIDNRTRDEFAAYIGPSLASRISEGGGIIECNWGSFRA